MNRVSAVMTAYNATATIEAALGSLLADGPSDLQIVVVDDGSTDGTAELVTAMGDGRVVLLQPGRLGRPRAFNMGVRAATGAYVAVADADDVSLSARWAAQLGHFAAHPETDVVGGQMAAHEGRHRWQLRFPTNHDAILKELDRGRMPIAHAGAMFRREWFLAAGGLNEDFARVEDFELYYRMRSSTTFGAVEADVVEYAFRTLDHRAWTRDHSFFARAVGMPLPASPGVANSLRYAKYRLVIGAQQRGLRVSPRSGGRT